MLALIRRVRCDVLHAVTALDFPATLSFLYFGCTLGYDRHSQPIPKLPLLEFRFLQPTILPCLR